MTAQRASPLLESDSGSMEKGDLPSVVLRSDTPPKLFSLCHVEGSTQPNTQGSGAKKLCFETKSFPHPKPTPRHTAWSKLWICVICCCRFNVNHGSSSPFQTQLGQGLITQTTVSAYLLSQCIFLHVHFCLPNTVWYECGLSEPGVHWKSRDISCREQAGVARCSAITREKFDGEQRSSY